MPQQPIELILTRQLASYLAVPVWVMSESGDLLYYNEAAEAVLGRRYDEAGEMPASELAEIFQVAAEDGSPLDAAPVTVALVERRPVTQRVRFKSLDGIWRLVDVAAFPVPGQGGRQLGAVAFFWEVQA
jgi:PAS domain S-box-containing protein